MTIPIRPAGPVPLSFPQERMFLLDRLMPGVPAYNVPRLARIARTLDPAVLQTALDGLVARHEALRTTIVLQAGEPFQIVSPAVDVSLTVSDVRTEPGDREAAALDRIAEVAWQSFDIARDVLLRAALVHVGDDDDLLLLVNHHLGSDHASGALLFSELSERYDAILAGRKPELPDLPIQYADYAAWQRSQMDGRRLGELLEHWCSVLDGAPDRLELPTDRPRPPAATYRGDQLELSLEPELVAELQALARASKVSLFVVLLTAFKVLLHRYSGATDLVVGTPVSGRNYEETISLVGYFSNTLVLRSDLTGEPTFRELLGRVGGVTRTALAYQELPFERLVQAINPDRAASHTPIFQVLFGFDVDPGANRSFAGAPLQRLPTPGNDFARFDLSLVVRHRPDGRITGELEYATDLFDPSTARRLLGHFRTILEGIARDPDARLPEIPLLTDGERAQMLQEWNATAAELPDKCLHELFAEQAAIRPDAIAVEFEHERLTYAELDRRSNQLAGELADLGAGPGTLVAIYMTRSASLVVALFGVLKTGAAYVPIDPSYPHERISFFFESADPPVIVTEEALAPGLPAHHAQVLALDSDWPRIATRGSDPPAVAVDPSALAYVMYTSGSTGKPKGVEICHRSVINVCNHMRREPGLVADDIVANLTGAAFDLSVPDWYMTLCYGAQLVIVPSDDTLDGVALGDRLRRSRATFVQATPTSWQLLLDAAWHGSDGLKILVGGEAVPRALVNQLLKRGSSVWHAYGPTETTVWSSIRELGPGEGPVPLGGPIDNTSFYVLDAAGSPVPIGVPGELYIGGAGLARGYRGRPDLTAERFLPDPFAPGPDARIYKTGDLVRWRENATLEFLGRIDQQVKLRGFRLELAEVEAVLALHPQVAATAATVRDDSAAGARLVAYFVREGDESPSVDELRNLIRAHVPPYMVPSAFVELDAMPTTMNRKLDRKALPAPDGARMLERPYAPPTRPVEEKLVEIWQAVLALEQVGIDDDFFDLGGHSLLAVKLLSAVVETFDVDLPLTSVFDRPTIRAQGELVSERLLDETSIDDLEALLAEIDSGA